MAGESVEVLTVGDPAPNFECTGTDGEMYTLSDFDEYSAVLIVFTCNHCPYAQAKHPALNQIAEDYTDVAVVGINPNDAEAYPDDSFDRMVEAVASGTVAYDAYLRDESQTVAAAYGAVCTPDPFLFARNNGQFNLVYHGRIDDATSPEAEPSDEPGFLMRQAIDAALEGDSPDLEFQPARGCTIKWRPGNEPDYWDDL